MCSSGGRGSTRSEGVFVVAESVLASGTLLTVLLAVIPNAGE